MCAQLIEKGSASGLSAEDAWNQASVELTKAAESHCRAFLVERYVDTVRNGMNNLNPELRTVMEQLCELYAVYWTLLRSGDFLLVSKYSYYYYHLIYQTFCGYYFLLHFN